MFGFIEVDQDKSILFLKQVSNIVCGVSNVGESEMLPTIDLVYPTLYQITATQIAKKMVERGVEPVVHINRDTQQGNALVQVSLVLPLRETPGGKTRLIAGAFWRIEQELMTQFLRKFFERRRYKVEVGRLSPDVEKVSMWSDQLRIFTDSEPETIH